MFSELAIWQDQTPRTGAENMAIDQALLENGYTFPILRVYEWSLPTVSFGYFCSLKEAQRLVSAESGSNLHYIRRWTGGGVVDHRVDITYTLVIPRSERLAQMRGAESYHLIHQALAEALREMGEEIQMDDLSKPIGGGETETCFTNPVPYDLSDFTGQKIAGAGQKRSRHGLLHQGSIIPTGDRSLCRERLPSLLGGNLTERQHLFVPDEDVLDRAKILRDQRYASSEWTSKR